MLTGILKHSIIQAGGRVVGLVIGLITLALMTRYLGATQFGWYITAFSWLQFFGITVDFGLYMTGLKILGQYPHRQSYVFSQLFWLRLFSAILLLLMAPQVIWLTAYAVEVKLAMSILSGSFFLASINQLLTVSYQQQVKMGVVALAEILGKLVALVGLLIVIHAQLGFLWVITSTILYGALQVTLLFWNKSDAHILQWVWDRVLVREIVHQSWPVALVIVCNTVYFKADTVLLSWFAPAATVGYYGAAYKVLEVLVAFPAMYLGLLLPHVSQWWQRERELLRKVIQQSCELMAVVVLPMVVLGIPVAPEVMSIVAGDSFGSAGQLLQVLLLATGFIFFGQLFGYVLVGIGKQKKQLTIVSTVAGLALVAYCISIPLYGALGAAITTSVVELMVLVLSAYWVYRYTNLQLVMASFGWILGAGVGAGLIQLLVSVWYPWWAALMIALLTYSMILLYTKVVTISQLREFIRWN